MSGASAIYGCTRRPREPEPSQRPRVGVRSRSPTAAQFHIFRETRAGPRNTPCYQLVCSAHVVWRLNGMRLFTPRGIRSLQRGASTPRRALSGGRTRKAGDCYRKQRRISFEGFISSSTSSTRGGVFINRFSLFAGAFTRNSSTSLSYSHEPPELLWYAPLDEDRKSAACEFRARGQIGRLEISLSIESM